MVAQKTIFPIAYFPPVHWFAKAVTFEKIYLEVHQYFQKQHFTNRMHIRAANRILPLTIPIVRRGSKTSIKEKKISYAEEWQKHHWHSLLSAYRNSAYFIFYEESLGRLYNTKKKFLLDFLMDCMGFILDAMELELEFAFPKEYAYSDQYDYDLRNAFDPSLKSLPDWFYVHPYHQVFEGFSPGLSILDLLFNEGRMSKDILKKSHKQ